MASIEIMSGNELIIQGGLEAGFHLYTGYPGSPLADYFNILYTEKKELQKKGIKVAIANSEANAAAMASGCKQAGRDCLVAMKSMGLHVASDALSVGNFANPGPEVIDPKTGEATKPGVVVVVGDDPWSMSTSTPADSRYLYKHLHIPFLEPSTPQELKDWIKHALEISKRTSVYCGVLLTTFMAEGGGRVELGEEAKIDGEQSDINTQDFDLSKNVMVPPNSLKADVSMIEERFPKVYEVLAQVNLDDHFGNENSEIGFLSSGVIVETLKQVLEESNLLETFDLYKLACSFPLIDKLLLPWLRKKKTVIVVEEKRGFLEAELSAFCVRHKLDIQIIGKKIGEEELFVAHGGLNFEIIQGALQKAFSFLGINGCKDLNPDVKILGEVLPRRLPTFCPGCPHRETLSLLKDLRVDLSNEGIDLVSHGDVGCYSLSFLPPFKEMHNLSAMGQGGALGAGMDMFTKNPSVTLMGDSTFFHSGITDVSNSVQCDHNITYIILDNDNTAMTGHQMTPSSGENVEGRKRPKQDILNAVKALGVVQAIEVNPSDRYFYKNILKDYVKSSGVKVIVSNKECGLTFHGRRKSKERKAFSKGESISTQRFFQINTDACEDCRVCVESTGCPGLTQVEDAYGTKVAIDPQICVADSYCTKLKACPSFEAVDVINYNPTKYKKHQDFSFDIENLPEPVREITFESISQGQDFRVVVTGVGGSGVTTISRVLAQASKEMNGRDDLDFKFMDQKGLAQRNGNVTGHMAIIKKGKSSGAVTPLASADLLLSPDLLDGSNQIQFLSNQGMALFDKTYQMPLSLLLDNAEEKEAITPDLIIRKLKNVLGDKAKFFDLKDICSEALGKSVYASAMLLGVAYQSGKMPFTEENMKKAFDSTIRKEELESNWMAFQLGRKIFIEGSEEFYKTLGSSKGEDHLHLFKQSLKESMLPWLNKTFVLNNYEYSLKRLIKLFPEIKKSYLAQYLHDLFIYDRGSRVEDFIAKAAEVGILYKETHLKQMALRVLAKTYFVKDEVFISHMMVSPMKRARDAKAFKSLGTGFRISRINRPAFEVFGKKIEFDISPSDWMLKSMRHLRILRIFLSAWHKRERDIGHKIREALFGDISHLKGEECRQQLKRLENIKGYREVRYLKSDKVFNN